jgi:hypothetical protein
MFSSMGNALNVALQWTSSDLSSRRLELTQENDSMLNKIVDFVTSFRCQHSVESNFLFRQPLVWNTTIDFEELASVNGFYKR